MGYQHSRFEGALCFVSHARRLTDIFQVPGKRTTGTGAQKYAITGPGWSGTVPAGVTEYKSPTGMVWLLGRIYCTGTPEDYKAVHAIQDQMTAVPLSSYGKPSTPAPGTVDPAIDTKTGVREQLNAMDGASYFKMFAQLLKANPPSADDVPMVAKLAKIGVVRARNTLKTNADGSTDLYIQADSPGKDKESNWLPAPKDDFVLMTRMYCPRKNILRFWMDRGRFPARRKSIKVAE